MKRRHTRLAQKASVNRMNPVVRTSTRYQAREPRVETRRQARARISNHSSGSLFSGQSVYQDAIHLLVRHLLGRFSSQRVDSTSLQSRIRFLRAPESAYLRPTLSSILLSGLLGIFLRRLMRSIPRRLVTFPRRLLVISTSQRMNITSGKGPQTTRKLLSFFARIHLDHSVVITSFTSPAVITVPAIVCLSVTPTPQPSIRSLRRWWHVVTAERETRLCLARTSPN